PAIGYKARVGGLAKYDPHVRPLATQNPPDADNRAPGTVAGDEHIEALAGEIAKNLASRRRFMDVRVRLRFELVGEEPTIRLGQLNGLLIHPEAFGRARREDDLGPEHTHELTPFDREAVCHGHHERIALLRADHGEADARVAACCLDNGLAGLECAASL